MDAVRVGVCGLGRAFTLMLPTFAADPRIELSAAADPDAETRAAFTAAFDAPAFATLAQLCAEAAVDAIYVASPHELHCEHALEAIRAGKHVLVEKPMAITLEEGRAMVAAADAAGVHLVVGPSHSFDAPVLQALAIIRRGAVGRVRMIHALNYTDFLYRPRRPEELDSARGGGVVFSQGAHQIDVARLLGGGQVRTVRAHTGDWDPDRSTEGAYALTLTFEDGPFSAGAFASLSYSGYAHFDSDALLGWQGELGRPKDAQAYGQARRALAGAASTDAEAALKRSRAFGGPGFDLAASQRAPAGHEHFGMLLVSCEHADLWPTPAGVTIYGDSERRTEPLAIVRVPRQAVVDELHGAVVGNRAPLHSGAWGLATLEVCLGVLRSAAEGCDIPMTMQVPTP